MSDVTNSIQFVEARGQDHLLHDEIHLGRGEGFPWASENRPRPEAANRVGISPRGPEIAYRAAPPLVRPRLPFPFPRPRPKAWFIPDRGPSPGSPTPPPRPQANGLPHKVGPV